MNRKPRNPKEQILTPNLLIKSILQGLVIFASSFGLYYYMLQQNPDNAALARSMGLAVIMLSNLFLVQVNSSNTDFAIQSLKNLIKDKVMWIVNIGTIAGLIILLYSPLHTILKLYPLSASQALTVAAIAAVSVLWYEVVKLVAKIKRHSKAPASDKLRQQVLESYEIKKKH